MKIVTATLFVLSTATHAYAQPKKADRSNETGNIKLDVSKNQNTGSEDPYSNVEELIKNYITTTPRYAIKLYNNTVFPGTTRTGSALRTHEFSEDRFIQPSLAFRTRMMKGNFHEIEISDLSVRRKRDRYIVNYPPAGNITTAGTQVTATSIALRYEYQYALFKRRNFKLQPSIGISGSAYYERFKTVPYTTNVYPTTETNTGIRGFIIPRLNWHVSRRLFFDVNLTVCILQGGAQFSYLQDPTLSKNQQRYGIATFNMFPPHYSFRIGAGWTF